VADGADLDTTIATVRATIPRVYLVAHLDTLYYVWKSGRVPRIAYAGSSLLNLKPVFEMHRGEVKSIARPRSSARAQRRLIEQVHRRSENAPCHAAVIHADAVDAAETLKVALEDEVDCAELYVSEFSPVMGAHTGPGLVGIAFWSEKAGSGLRV
jgi:DegV family protein with EDD domain